MKTTLLASLTIAIVGALAQQQSPVPTAQPPAHTFPDASNSMNVPSDASLPTSLGTKVEATGSDISATLGSPTATSGSAAATESMSGSGSGTAAAGSTSSGLAVPTGHPNVIPAIGLAAALLAL